MKIIEGINLFKYCLKISVLPVDSFFAYVNLGVSHEIFHEYDSAFLYFEAAKNIFFNNKFIKFFIDYFLKVFS